MAAKKTFSTLVYSAPFGPNEELNPDGVYKTLVVEIREEGVLVQLRAGDPGLTIAPATLTFEEAGHAFLNYFLQNAKKGVA